MEAHARTRTQIDGLFDIKGANESNKPSLEELAARINFHNCFIIGPEKGMDSDPLSIEVEQARRQVLNEPAFRIGRIKVGDEDHDCKLFIVLDNKVAEEKAVYIISSVAKYDENTADSLIKPMAKELLLERINDQYEGEAIRARTSTEVRGMIQRLEKFSRDEYDEQVGVELQKKFYTSLAEALRRSLVELESEEEDVLASSADYWLIERKKNYKINRIAKRIGALICVGCAFCTAYGMRSLIDTSKASDDLQGKVLLESDMITSDINTADAVGLLDIDSVHKDSVAEAIKSKIDYYSRDITSLKNRYKSTEDTKLIEMLTDIQKTSAQSIDDKMITREESNIVNRKNVKISAKVAESYDVDKFLLGLIGVSSLFYLTAGAGLAYSASRKGGHFDPKMKMYKKGQISDYDFTFSPSVNSRNSLGKSLNIIETDLSVL